MSSLSPAVLMVVVRLYTHLFSAITMHTLALDGRTSNLRICSIGWKAKAEVILLPSTVLLLSGLSFPLFCWYYLEKVILCLWRVCGYVHAMLVQGWTVQQHCHCCCWFCVNNPCSLEVGEMSSYLRSLTSHYWKRPYVRPVSTCRHLKSSELMCCTFFGV